MNSIYFMPLGGGQRIGASCYYMRLGEKNIILDAGIGEGNRTPTTYSLLTSPFMECINQIDQIYISHAHMDHIGYLPQLIENTSKASVYMTKATSLLLNYQLFKKNYITKAHKCKEDIFVKHTLEKKVNIVSYNQEINFKKHKVTFLSAGHIPGAMMVLFEYEKRKILYTGDYSLGETLLTSKCIIPKGLKIDTLILCGVYAKHSQYIKKKNKLLEEVNFVLESVKKNQTSIMCYVPQLSKGIEFIKALNKYNVDNIPIYMDESILDIVKSMEELHIPLLNSNNKEIGSSFPKQAHIFITANIKCKRDTAYRMYKTIDIKFSLHDDFLEIKKLIEKINPQKAVIVHCVEKSPGDKTIEEEMKQCQTEFIFAEENQLYEL